MLVIISPAKKLDFDSVAPTEEFSKTAFLDQSKELIANLKKLKAQDIKKLMKLSDTLVDLNMERYKNFKPPFTPQNSKQAVYAFQGDTYVGLDAATLKKNEINYAQKHLRILSGLYGVLAPLDLIQPYRLEMGTKLQTKVGKNLYEYWGDSLTKNLNQILKKEKYLINLASKEYFSVLDFKKLVGVVITPVFKEKKGDDYKVVGLFSKRARGMMSRYIIQNKITKVEELQNFSEAGYKFSQKLSNENELIFTRTR